MNQIIDLGPDLVAVDLENLREVFQLLNEAKLLHEGGHYEAHKVSDAARLALAKLIEKATA
jgi:hypothetical protein